MLSLFLPPLIIAIAFVCLFWMFKHKIPEVKKMQETMQENMRSVRMKNLFRNSFVQTVTEKIRRKRQSLYTIFHKRSPIFLDEVKPGQNYEKAGSDELGIQKKKMEKIHSTFSQSLRQQKNHKHRNDYSNEEKVTVPMLSSVLVRPSRSSFEVKKSQFEEIMIERVAMNPRDIEAYERLGEYYMQMENYDDAKECYKQVLRLSPVNRKAKIRMRRLEKIFAQKTNA